jgi:hypothetical protein
MAFSEAHTFTGVLSRSCGFNSKKIQSQSAHRHPNLLMASKLGRRVGLQSNAFLSRMEFEAEAGSDSGSDYCRYG